MSMICVTASFETLKAIKPWKITENIHKLNLKNFKLYGPFLWMRFNCLKAREPLRGGSLLYTTKF